MAGPSTDERDKAEKRGAALPGGRFPIRNREDLLKAIRAVGRARGGEKGRTVVRRFIIKRARALNLASLIPDSWNSDGTLKSGD